ncbi:hypothetical protein JD844_013861 [Phrynosoma platyrhinos]|uniref:Uncharacterized protein n=1 Tax=Phrynosoma platyrhinos TaxID=52577 RepID=A0ABQ7TME4_PHRPL|nr:hypothetical protein JD844_013861 [Phrynosoma platyrhinos]
MERGTMLEDQEEKLLCPERQCQSFRQFQYEEAKGPREDLLGEKATEILEAEKVSLDSGQRAQPMQILQEGSGNAVSLGDERLPRPRCTASALHSGGLRTASESLDQDLLGEKATEILEAEKVPLDSGQRAQPMQILQEGSGNAISLGLGEAKRRIHAKKNHAGGSGGEAALSRETMPLLQAVSV